MQLFSIHISLMTLMTLSKGYESGLCMAPVEDIWRALVMPLTFLCLNVQYSCLRCWGEKTVLFFLLFILCIFFWIYIFVFVFKKLCRGSQMFLKWKWLLLIIYYYMLCDAILLFILTVFILISRGGLNAHCTSLLSSFRNSTLESWICQRQICFWSQKEARPSCFPRTQILLLM